MITKTVADPIDEVSDMYKAWLKCRVVCAGEAEVKNYDYTIDVVGFTNLLIPFSVSMDQNQYDFYKAEAELPGIMAQFSKMLVGGLLRKQPVLQLPDTVPPEASEWINSAFGRDDAPLVAFLDDALWEEIQTSRAWIFVDHPYVPEGLTFEELTQFKPYPVLRKAEHIINWQTTSDQYGKTILSLVCVLEVEKYFEEDKFHPKTRNVVWVHALDEEGLYYVEKHIELGRNDFKVEKLPEILVNDKRLPYIPAWPLNGSIPLRKPILASLVDKELSLYNKLSRRNHLLYGAATYTPVISADITDEEFAKIVGSGLGAWILLPENGKAGVLETPSGALADMDRAIAASVEDIAKLGVRMLSPENVQSGVALDIRNASQTAQLGTLNTKASNTMKQVIAFMLNWRYDLDLKDSDIVFSLTADFKNTPVGADWMRLITEWYQMGLIPRSVWLNVLQHNDVLEGSYDDEEGQKEIAGDAMIVSPDTSSNIKNG